MKTSLVAFFILFCFCAKAQQQNIADKIGLRIDEELIKYYHPDADSIKSFCQVGIVFTRFEIDKSGNLKDITFNKRAVGFITIAIRAALDSMLKDKELVTMLEKVHKPIIKPLLYYYQEGCNFPRDGLTTEQQKIRSFSERYMDILLKLDHTAEYSNFILESNSDKHFGLDCLLLSPAWVASGAIY